MSVYNAMHNPVKLRCRGRRSKPVGPVWSTLFHKNGSRTTQAAMSSRTSTTSSSRDAGTHDSQFGNLTRLDTGLTQIGSQAAEL